MIRIERELSELLGLIDLSNSALLKSLGAHLQSRPRLEGVSMNTLAMAHLHYRRAFA
jgi:hypothetical protein